jgi:predicted DNA-binding antitoxin AbrB/MazE fold protein
MTITATAIYENGVLRLLRPLALPERTRIRIQIEPESEVAATEEGHILYDLLALAEDLGVNDLAEQHDHYLYGVEKQ